MLSRCLIIRITTFRKGEKNEKDSNTIVADSGLGKEVLEMFCDNLISLDVKYELARVKAENIQEEINADCIRELACACGITTNEAMETVNRLNSCGLVNAITPEDTRAGINIVIDEEIEEVRRDPLLNWFQKRKRIKELKRGKYLWLKT